MGDQRCGFEHDSIILVPGPPDGRFAYGRTAPKPVGTPCAFANPAGGKSVMRRHSLTIPRLFDLLRADRIFVGRMRRNSCDDVSA